MGLPVDNIGVIQKLIKNVNRLGRETLVISKNLQGAGVPGFKAQMLREDQKKGVSGPKIKMAATKSSHMQPTVSSSANAIKTKDLDDPFEVSKDGNTVSLEQQNFLMADVLDKHDLNVRVLKECINMLRAARSIR